MRRACLFSICATLSALVLACGGEQKFPNQIPGIVATLGKFHTALSRLDRVPLDSVCTDRELYDEMVAAFATDSLAVLSRQIRNPVDSAYVIMTVARHDRATHENKSRFQLELYLRKEENRFCIVAHKLTPSPP